MREQSVYCVECAKCGANVETHTPEGVCPKCSTPFRVERGTEMTGGSKRASA